ncbi:MAG TPA: hydantoinase/oxoprolinase family protein, partial [Erysipelothrix sp.]|nr:hydantoinase/oxoprolinase family protein [Erysipelothrix sp.]
VHNVGRWSLMEATIETKKLFLTFKKQVCCVMDREGVVRFRNEKVNHLKFSKDKLQSQFLPFIDDNTIYSDANATIPKVFIFYREKMLDLTGMHNLEQLISIMDVELKILPEDEPILALAYQ